MTNTPTQIQLRKTDMKYILYVAMDIRAYGTVEVETDDLNKITDSVDAAYVAKHFEPHGSGSDDLDYNHPSDICITEILDEDYVEYDVPEDLECLPDGEWIRS